MLPLHRVQRKALNNGKEEAGRSSEQLTHIHIAKIAIRFHFSKKRNKIFNETLENANHPGTNKVDAAGTDAYRQMRRRRRVGFRKADSP